MCDCIISISNISEVNEITKSQPRNNWNSDIGLHFMQFRLAVHIDKNGNEIITSSPNIYEESLRVEHVINDQTRRTNSETKL